MERHLKAIAGLTWVLHGPSRQPEDYSAATPVQISVNADTGVAEFRLTF